jgi:ABC-type phosphate/phosphonate transport system substrate-binding protein/membrane-associated phospholipid phosphatase
MARLAPALPTRYRLVREIGRGGTSRVFLAEESHPRRQVAIKVLEPAVAAAIGRDRFLREVEFASGLSHPHILPIFAAAEADGLLFYVMPYIPGDTVRGRLARERVLPIAQALQIGREVADALQYAHERDIIHRDIKPENILLQAGHAVVSDFGIARAAAAQARGPITETGFVVGTPAYMSPEQASGDEKIDGRTDIYSLGCVIYEMLTGETPHSGPTPDAIIIKKLNVPVASVSLLRPTVPPAVEHALSVALARTPADRYASAAEFRDVLGTTLAAPAPAAMPAPETVAATPPGRDALAVTAVRPERRSTGAGTVTSRAGLSLLLVAVALFNWAQTTLDNWIGTQSQQIIEWRHQLAHALQWMEGGMTFAGHDVTNRLAVYGYAAAYFFVFPALLLAVLAALVRRRAIAPYRHLVTAVVLDYALSLPFYLLLPVPERWSFPESGAIMLSDRWSSGLIQAVRPISGLDNCFPSFHVSLTVIAVLLAYVHRVRFRLPVLACGLMVLCSTFMLGIHWIADMIAGAALGVLSVALAQRLERRRAAARTPTRPVLAAATAAVLALAMAPAPADAQTPAAFIAVDLDSTSRRADRALRQYLERRAGMRFATEQSSEYGSVIDRLVTWSADRGPFLARITPYALVAAELLGADVRVLATYVSRATGGTTYRSYLVVQRDRFPYPPDLAFVPAFLRSAAAPRTFAYVSEFSASGYFLPALYFRRNDIFDMAASAERATAIRARAISGNSADLVRGVAEGRYDMAAVWSGTRAAFESGAAAAIGRRVHFLELPTVLPNDLLVVSGALDSASVAAIRSAIRSMTPDAIAEGDFVTWRDVEDATSAREALADLRWLAREQPAEATVEVLSAPGHRVAAEQVTAVRQAIRLAGPEFASFDPDFHAQQDYVWTLQPMHDGALLVRSRIAGSDTPDQEFQITFRNAEELADRVGEIIRSRLHRIRYLWPYRTNPPTILRDIATTLPPGSRVTVRKIRWLDPHRHAFNQDATLAGAVARTDFYKIELAPSLFESAAADSFAFGPMSNTSYRVVLERSVHERPVFRVLTVALLGLIVVAGVSAGVDLRRMLRESGAGAAAPV